MVSGTVLALRTVSYLEETKDLATTVDNENMAKTSSEKKRTLLQQIYKRYRNKHKQVSNS
eukprot:3826979-Amphidinium_carterae.1